jgi:anti-sigma regulatory factor (Ser/Thr protein kinase)
VTSTAEPCTARDDWRPRGPARAGDGSPGAPLTASVGLPPRLEAAALGRRFVRMVLAEWGFEADSAYTVQLVTTELVSNAVRHAAADEELELSLVLEGDRVTVGLSDGSAIPPVVAALTHDAESGRGMSIITEVAAAWGTAERPTGKQVWARLELCRREPGGQGSNL